MSTGEYEIKVKVGDKIQLVDSGNIPQGSYEGDIAEVLCTRGDGGVFIKTRSEMLHGTNCDCGKHRWVLTKRDYKLVSSKSTIMNIKEKFALAFKSEPEKTFRKAGITNGDDFLTDDGQKIFLSWLLKKYGADFKKEVVDDLVKEDEDKK